MPTASQHAHAWAVYTKTTETIEPCWCNTHLKHEGDSRNADLSAASATPDDGRVHRTWVIVADRQTRWTVHAQH